MTPQGHSPRYGLTRLCLSLYLLATLGLTSCATPGTRLGQAGAVNEFLFSPYMDLNIPVQAESPTALSGFIDSIRSLLGLPSLVFPKGLNALTLAFATGECGREHWDGMSAQKLANADINALRRAGIGYMISTGGAQGIFTCSSEQGMEAFISRYSSTHLLGFDFDIEAGQSGQDIFNLVTQIHAAMQRHPHLRFSFTLATTAFANENEASLSPLGERVMATIKTVGLRNHYINLMTMNYGEASADTCVMNDANRCDMAASALRSVQNFSKQYGVPLNRLEVTPMIGVNDVESNVFTLQDARVLANLVAYSGLGGLHFWSINRDASCPPGVAALSPLCHGLANTGKLDFTNTFLLNTPAR